MFGWAWIGFAIALTVHVTDEAIHDFLSVYNPAVRAFRARLPFLPLPTFRFGIWLGGLIAAIALLLVLSPLAFAGSRWLRGGALILAIIVGLGNGLGHIVASVWRRKMMPGTWSAPLLLTAAIALIAAAS